METIPLPCQKASNHHKVTGAKSCKLSRILQALFQKFNKQSQLKRDLNHLLSLDDRMLKDINVSRHEVKRLLKKNSIVFLDCDPPFCVGMSNSYDFKTLFQSYTAHQ